MNENRFKFVILITLLVFSSHLFAADSIGLPSDFPELIINQYGETAPGVLIGWFGFWSVDYYVVLDQVGYPIFYSKTEQMSYPGVMFNGLISAPADNGFNLKDETFTIVDSFELVGDYEIDIHDFKVMPNGHAFLLGTYPINIDMSKIVPGGRTDAQLTGNVIQEIDANKNVVFEWHAYDHIPVTDSYHDLTVKSIDYAHFNSVNIDPFDNHLLVSFRTTSEIVKVSRSTGEILWHFGGKNNDFTFIGEHEENAPLYFVGQHSVWRLENGDIMFFDNGNISGGGLTDNDRDYSRAVAYHLDEENMEATLVWEFRHDPDIDAPSSGRVQPLSNGNVLITWGSAVQGTANVPLVTEVSPTGELVYEMYYANSTKGARFQKYIWNSPDLVKSETFSKINSGSIYRSDEAGITLGINELEGTTNNGLVVKKHLDATRFPEFSGKAPQVLMKRVTVSGFGIEQVTFDINFDIDGMDFKDPNEMTVYHRPFPGQGIFTPLTTIYDSDLKQIIVINAAPGEFIFTYPDAQPIPLAPILDRPANMGLINQSQPVMLKWIPKGFYDMFQLQVALDEGFSELIVNEPGLIEFEYTIESVDPNTIYYWRVNTTNEGGTSDWSASSFTTAEPVIELISPNGGEHLRRGFNYLIQWDYNLSEDVVIELYRGNSSIKIIDTVYNTGSYDWEVGLGVRSSTDYSIKIKSTVDETVFDMSDAPFSISQ